LQRVNGSTLLLQAVLGELQGSLGAQQLLPQMLDLLLHTMLVLHTLATIIVQALHMNSVNACQ